MSFGLIGFYSFLFLVLAGLILLCFRRAELYWFFKGEMVLAIAQESVEANLRESKNYEVQFIHPDKWDYVVFDCTMRVMAKLMSRSMENYSHNKASVKLKNKIRSFARKYLYKNPGAVISDSQERFVIHWASQDALAELGAG